jgi:hypothetical protein
VCAGVGPGHGLLHQETADAPHAPLGTDVDGLDFGTAAAHGLDVPEDDELAGPDDQTAGLGRQRRPSGRPFDLGEGRSCVPHPVRMRGKPTEAGRDASDVWCGISP